MVLKKKLWAFNWTSGGFNQVYAHSKEEAIEEVKKEFSGLKMNESTLYLVTDENRYYSSSLFMD